MSHIAPFALIRVACLYFLLAVLALVVTRYDGGIAFLWFATAYLFAEMSIVPRRRWAALIAAASCGSIAATGLFGLGWAAALPMAGANMIEALLAAYLVRTHARQAPFESLGLLARYAVSIAVIAPVASSLIAGMVMWPMGIPVGPAMLHWITGHALSNFTFAPILQLIAHGELGKSLRELRGRRAEAMVLIVAATATTALSFAQNYIPLLFLPILPILIVTFRLGRGAAAISILALAIVGGSATLAGIGPVHLLPGDDGSRAQFFQFYLAITVITVWPVAADLRYRAQLHSKLRVSEARYRLIANHSSDILMKIDRGGFIRYVSPSIRDLGGYDPDLLTGRHSAELIAPEHLGRASHFHRLALEQPDLTFAFEYLAITASGTRRWFETHLRAVVNEEGKAIETISIIRDVTGRKNTEQTLSHAAHTDALTGLPNRRAFCDLAEARPNAGGDCVAILDIDHFKKVNDTYGHEAGDAVLRTFAAIAQSSVRDGDLIARLGGEEFAVLFPGTSLQDSVAICDRLRSDLAEARVVVGGASIRVTVSGGVAAIGAAGLDEALKQADAALYRAKGSGRDQLAAAA